MASISLVRSALHPFYRLSLATLIMLAANDSALAQDADAWTQCNDSNYQRAIAGCTAIIDLGNTVPAAQLAQAYMKRGRARANDAIMLNREVRKRQLDEAVADLNEAIRLDAKSVGPAYRQRGVIFEEYGDLNRALADYNASIGAGPTDPFSYLTRGQFYEKRNDLDRALADYSRGIELKPVVNGKPASFPFSMRGDLYAKQRKFKLALADFESAIALESSNAILQEYREKKDRFENAVAAEYVTTGQTAFQAGDYPRAIADFSEAIRLNSGSFPAYFGRALAYDKSGDANRALDDASVAVRRNERSIEARAFRAELLVRKSSFKDALAELEAAFKLGLKFDWPQTLAQQSAAISRNPQSARAYADRGWTHLMQGEIDPALSDLTTAVKVDGKFVMAYQLRALAYEKKAEYRLALADYDTILSLRPKDDPLAKWVNTEITYLRARAAAFLLKRGAAARAKRDFAPALADFTDAIEFTPKSNRESMAQAYHERALVHIAQSRPADAIADLTQTIAFEFRFRDAYIERAELYEKRGDLAAALKDYDTVLGIGPRLPNADELKARAERLRGQVKPRP